LAIQILQHLQHLQHLPSTSQTGWWTGGRLLVDLSHAVGIPGLPSVTDNRYMRFTEAGTSPRRQVLETDAAVVFMSEAAAGSAHRFPFWHGRVGDGITMTIDIRIGQPSAPNGSPTSKFFYNYAAAVYSRSKGAANDAWNAGMRQAVADYPYSNLTPDPDSDVLCSWCRVAKPDPNEDVNAIFQQKGYGRVWNTKRAMHNVCFSAARRVRARPAVPIFGAGRGGAGRVQR
jgi:hypothetical protein